MKKLLIIPGIVIAVAIAFVGCTKPGYLVIDNETNDLIWVAFDGDDLDYDSDQEVDPDDSIEQEYDDLSYTLLESEVRNVEYTVSGYYKFTETVESIVTAGETTTESIEADAGAMVINNTSGRTIDRIYLAPSSDPTWGSDDLSGTISSGSSYIYTLSAGNWDIRIIDTSDIGGELFGISVPLDGFRTVTYGSSMISVQSAQESSAEATSALEDDVFVPSVKPSSNSSSDVEMTVVPRGFSSN